MLFETRGIRATIDPRNLEYGVLQRADIVVLRMIRDSWPERPIYFARSSGSYPRQLGLENNVLTQGLAAKVFVPPAAPTKDTVFVNGDAWLDVGRTQALWDSVFVGPKSVIARGDWIDRPSVGIPFLYVQSGVELAGIQDQRGNARVARQLLDTARRVAAATRLTGLIGEAEPSAAASTPGDTARSVDLRVNPIRQPVAPTTSPTTTRPRRE
jgi:hypothetical protein